MPISKDVILAPSAVNSQPWYIKNSEESLLSYRNNLKVMRKQATDKEKIFAKDISD